MPQNVLRVVAKGGPLGGPMVPHYESLMSGGARGSVSVRRFIGRRHDPKLGPLQEHPETRVMSRPGGFVAHLSTPEKIHAEAIFEIVIDGPNASKFLREYAGHLRDGDLLPADEFTAGWADTHRRPEHPLKGTKFDPVLKGAAMWGEPPPEADTAPNIAALHEQILKALGGSPAASTSDVDKSESDAPAGDTPASPAVEAAIEALEHAVEAEHAPHADGAH